MYDNGMTEASKVPADWWLSYHTNQASPEGGYARHAWQQDHQPNTTGQTMHTACRTAVLKGGKAATGD